MEGQYIAERITELRLRKNISEYRMSLDLGHSNSYVRSISSGKALPSMSEFTEPTRYNAVEPGEEITLSQIDTLDFPVTRTPY